MQNSQGMPQSHTIRSASITFHHRKFSKYTVKCLIEFGFISLKRTLECRGAGQTYWREHFRNNEVVSHPVVITRS